MDDSLVLHDVVYTFYMMLLVDLVCLDLFQICITHAVGALGCVCHSLTGFAHGVYDCSLWVYMFMA